MTITEQLTTVLTTVQAQAVLRAHGVDLSQKVVRAMIRSGDLPGGKVVGRYYAETKGVDALAAQIEALESRNM